MLMQLGFLFASMLYNTQALQLGLAKLGSGLGLCAHARLGRVGLHLLQFIQ